MKNGNLLSLIFTAAGALLGLLIWFVVSFLALDSPVWAFTFAGYGGFAAFIVSIIYRYNHEKKSSATC